MRMRFSTLLSSLLLTIFLANSAFAAVGVTSSEIQSASLIVFPNASSIDKIPGYGTFTLKSRGNLENGIYSSYEAPLESNEYITEELPNLRFAVYAYSSQDSAESSFKTLKDLVSGNSTRKLLSSDDRNIYYKSAPGISVDVFSSITSEEDSLHLLHLNGNLIFQSSLYRGSGSYDQENVETFLTAIADTNQVKSLFEEALEHMKLAMGILYPPTDSDFKSSNQSDFVNLSDDYDFAENGSINFELYIDDSSPGTILDTSGISSAAKGDFYLYLNDEAKLVAGIYAPDYDSGCAQSSGWHKIESNKSLSFYEWNSVRLHYGVQGFWISINDVVTASCKVSQSRSANDVFLGDYPYDSGYESFSGYVDSIKSSYDSIANGTTWDSILNSQIFIDISASDPDLEALTYLKNAGVLLGNEGYLRPEDYLNRAEMVKMLLKSFGHSGMSGDSPFWDVASDAWYLKYVIKAYDIGMIKGHEDGSFLPGHTINRAEFFLMLARINEVKKVAYDFSFDDVDKDDWFLGAAAFALSEELVTSDSFLPERAVTRREAARSIYKVLQ